MTVISISGIAVGVAALIIVLSVMGGFERDLKDRMLKGLPHVEILAENSLAGFSLLKHPIEKFKKVYPDAVGIEPFVQADVVLKQGKHLASGIIFGVDGNQGGKLWGYSDSMIDGELPDIEKQHFPLVAFNEDESQWPGIVLGDKLAHQLGADIGDKVVVLSPSAVNSSASILAGGTLSRQYVLVGIFHTGLFNYDAKWAVVNLNEGRKFIQDYDPSLDEEQYVSGVGINAQNPLDIKPLKERVSQFAGLKAKTWQDVNASLILALQLEKFTMGSILMLIVLVAAFSISGTMMMAVFHKKRQVCLLRSVGMTQSDVVTLFLFHGFSIATIGILIGVVFGLFVCAILFLFRFWELPESMAILKTFPVKFLPVEYGVICLFAWFLSLLGASYPAWTASKQDPTSGLRY